MKKIINAMQPTATTKPKTPDRIPVSSASMRKKSSETLTLDYNVHLKKKVTADFLSHIILLLSNKSPSQY